MQDLIITPGTKITFNDPQWWSEIGIVWEVESAHQYSGIGDGLLIRLKGRNYDTIVSRKAFRIVEE